MPRKRVRIPLKELTPELYNFSMRYLTFINQFFGDQTVREIISEIRPSKKYKLEVEEAGEEFDKDSDHHVIIEKKTGNKLCSVKLGYQNTDNDTYDTLCHGYSLLIFLDKSTDLNDKIKRQMDIIAMYRELLDSHDFKKKLLKEIDIPNKEWKDYRDGIENEHTFDEGMTSDSFFENVYETLTEWELFGYEFFIGKYNTDEDEEKKKRRTPRVKVVIPDELRRRSKRIKDEIEKKGGKSQRYNLRKRRTTKKLR